MLEATAGRCKRVEGSSHRWFAVMCTNLGHLLGSDKPWCSVLVGMAYNLTIRCCANCCLIACRLRPHECARHKEPDSTC